MALIMQIHMRITLCKTVFMLNCTEIFKHIKMLRGRQVFKMKMYRDIFSCSGCSAAFILFLFYIFTCSTAVRAGSLSI